jgi:hypothetical protein
MVVRTRLFESDRPPSTKYLPRSVALSIGGHTVIKPEQWLIRQPLRGLEQARPERFEGKFTGGYDARAGE